MPITPVETTPTHCVYTCTFGVFGIVSFTLTGTGTGFVYDADPDDFDMLHSSEATSTGVPDMGAVQVRAD